MQKRRVGGGASNGSTLPLTSADLDALSRGRRTKRRFKRSRGGDDSFLCGPEFWGLMLLVVVLLLVAFLINGWGSPQRGSSLDEDVYTGSKAKKPPRAAALVSIEEGGMMGDKVSEERLSTVDRSTLPLAHFPTLPYALDNADLVGLYFAASWCPMSAPVTEALDEAFSTENSPVLPPPGTENRHEENKKDHSYQLAIVYVSSDKSEEEMTNYSRKNWINVPYNTSERSDLKKHFRTCAKIEVEELAIDRKNEIPTLIILDGPTHGILTTSGVEDVKEYGAKALDHWLDLQRLVRAMEDKHMS